MNFFRKVLFIMSNRHKNSLAILALLIFIGMLFEIVGLGVIMPIIGLLTNPKSIYNYKITNVIFTNLGNPSNDNIIIISMSFLASFYLVKAVYLTFLNWKQSAFSSEFTAYISHKLYRGYMYMPYVNHLERNSAILIRNIQTEVSIFTSLTQSIIFLSSEISVIGGVIILLVSLEPTGTLLIGLFLALAIFLYYIISKKFITVWGQKRQEFTGVISQNLMQGLGGIKDIKLIGKEDYFLKEFKQKNEYLSNINSKINTTDQLPRLFLEFVAVASVSGLIIIMVISNKPVNHIIPVLGIFVAATFRMIPSINKIMFSSQRIVYSMPVLDLLYDEFKMFSNMPSIKSDVSTSVTFKNEISIKSLNFKYKTSESYALTNINFKIKKGESIGIVGESGSGKSTLVDILLGLLEPTSGDIIVDNTILCYNNINSWQNTVAYVPQTIYLTDDTLKNNIALGEIDEEINEVNLNNAINDAQLFNFINTLSEGVNTKVGERGVRLSGGQRQRIGIARALYRNAQILVFDEATSALDNETEQSVMSAIDNLNGIKTLIIIAHRLTTVKNCSKIIEIKNGLIVKEGNPDTILRNN
jgi:ABC-type multidrug transport system fused ATPase/permease subunit